MIYFLNKRDAHHIIIILFTYNTDKTKYTIIKTINIILLIEKFVALKKKKKLRSAIF